MSFLKNLFGWLGLGSGGNNSVSTSGAENIGCTINPATGLPMVDGFGGVDVGGNPYGVDSHHVDDSWHSTTNGSHDDAWSSSYSSWDSGISNHWDD